MSSQIEQKLFVCSWRDRDGHAWTSDRHGTPQSVRRCILSDLGRVGATLVSIREHDGIRFVDGRFS